MKGKYILLAAVFTLLKQAERRSR